MGGAQAAEIVPLHRTGEALSDRGARHVDPLPGNEMVGGDFGTDLDEVLRADPEFRNPALRLDPGLGEMAPHGRPGASGLRRAGPELHRGVTVLVRCPLRHHLQLVDMQHGHRHLPTILHEQPRHSDFLCDHSRTHSGLPP